MISFDDFVRHARFRRRCPSSTGPVLNILTTFVNGATSLVNAATVMQIIVRVFVGSTREIGSALTRLCLRHRSIDAKLKTFARSALLLWTPQHQLEL